MKLGGSRGDLNSWVDVEGDEATKSDLTKTTREADPMKDIMWEQWLELVQRGRPEPVILERLHPPCTNRRPPGPGAIRKLEWTTSAKTFGGQPCRISHRLGPLVHLEVGSGAT